MITIRPLAIEKIKEVLADQANTNLFLRVGVVEGGCSGFNYAMGVDDAFGEKDERLEVEGIPVVIDTPSKGLLNGVVIDYAQSEMGGGFTIENPNATVTCGCGSSFRTATEAGKPSEC
jgi:iron-sulfur cluster assembly protein